MSNWTPIKPKFKRECLLLTASKSSKGVWYFHSWEISKINSDEGWYFGLCDLDGEEYGAIDDFNADLYKVISLPK